MPTNRGTVAGYLPGAKGPGRKGETPMRSPRILLASACLFGLASAGAHAQNYNPKDYLGLRPILKGVEYELVPDNAVASCKVVIAYVGKRPAGYSVTDGQGKTLRKFLDSAGKSRMDQWSYYQDGFEVYRETVLNGDQ